MRSPVAPDGVQALFNRIAPVYDQLNDGLSLGLHRVWKLMAVQWSGATPGATCLDVCCGSGDVTQLLAQQVGPNGHVVGVDFAASQLAIAQQRNDQRRSPLPITWVEGDALHLPFDDSTFDAATMSYGLRNVASIPDSLRELHRVLKPGATVAILDFHRPSSDLVRQFQHWYLATVVVPMAKDLGMEDEYAYLAPSIDRFPIGAEQRAIAHQVGFRQAIHYAIAGGLMGVLVATR
jgi:demethylmenaquinone methyltransferase/2-methoxy-6-polyprenyl-1,4-benzoquinol methylase